MCLQATSGKEAFDWRRHFLHHGLYSKETKNRRNKLLLFFVLAVLAGRKMPYFCSSGKADGSSQLSDSRWTDEVKALTVSLAELYTAGTMNLSWLTRDGTHSKCHSVCANNQQNSPSTVWAITHADFTDLPTTACTRTSLACIVQTGMQCLGPVLHSEMQMEQGRAGDAG